MTPEIMPELNVSNFDASFFAAYEQELAINFNDVAEAALQDILTVKTEDGADKTYEQLRAQTEQFFANPLIAQNIELMNALASQYAHFCNGHGPALMGALNSGPLNMVYEQGNAQAHPADDGHGHAGEAHELDDDDDEDEEHPRQRVVRHAGRTILQKRQVERTIK